MLALVVLTLAACAGDPAPAPMETAATPAAADTSEARPYVYLDAAARGLRAEIAVNGSPVATLDGADGAAASYTSAVNRTLVGEGNRLTVRLLAADPAAAEAARAAGWPGPEVPPDAALTLDVRRYPAGYDGFTGTGGEVLAELGLAGVVEAEAERRRAAFDSAVSRAPSDRARAALLADSAGHLAVRFPLEAEAAFDTADLPSFRAELFEREPVDREAVVDYAMRLREMLRAGDIDGLTREAQPKREWGNRALPQEYEPDYRAMFEEILAFGEVQADFGRDQVEAVSVNGGRLWQLSVRRAPWVDPKTGEVYPLPSRLIYAQNFETGRSTTFPVTVGMEGGRLRIVY